MSAAEVRAKAQKFEVEIRRDTIVGLILASAITMAGLIGVMRPQAEPAARIIMVVVVTLVWFGAWRNTVRNRNRLSGARVTTCLEFYRQELQRRRDYFAKPPWFLVFVILIALIQFFAVARRFNADTGDLLRYPVALAVLTLIAVPLWRRQAGKFQQELNELDKFKSE